MRSPIWKRGWIVAVLVAPLSVACGRSGVETEMHRQSAIMLVENRIGFAGHLEGSVRNELGNEKLAQLEWALDASKKSGLAGVAAMRAGAYVKVAGDALQEIGHLSEMAGAYGPKDQRLTEGTKSITSAIRELQQAHAGLLIVVAGYAPRADRDAALAMISSRCKSNAVLARSLRAALDGVRVEGTLAQEEGLPAVASACRE